MRANLRLFVAIIMIGVALVAARVARAQDEPPADNMCIQCHGTEEIWDANTRHLFVPAASLASDIHWQKGLLCQDCHGGDATTTDLRSAHAIEVGFHKINTPADIPNFCGRCHSDGEYMKKYRQDAPLDTVDKFWNSVHGQNLKKFAEMQKAAAPPAAAPTGGAETPAAAAEGASSSVPPADATAAPPTDSATGAPAPSDPAIAPQAQAEPPADAAAPVDTTAAAAQAPAGGDRRDASARRSRPQR